MSIWSMTRVLSSDEPVERDDAGVPSPVDSPPRDPLVGVLLGDLGVPLAPSSPRFVDPVEVGVVELVTRSTPP